MSVETEEAILFSDEAHACLASDNGSTETADLPDVASQIDERGVNIHQVGVTDLHLPLLIRRKNNGHVAVCAHIDMRVDLLHRFRGTHMSRFIEILNAWRERPLARREIEIILREAHERFQCRSSRLDVRFKYFVSDRAPASGEESVLDYDCLFSGGLDPSGFEFILGVDVPVLTLCPCSKEISRYGAHSQRGVVRVWLRNDFGKPVWIEDLVALVRAQGSAPIYPLLKREDEKAVTEMAYENPRFVEDMVREVVLKLREWKHVRWFRVEAENFESIHNHNAVALYDSALESEPVKRGDS